MSYRCEECGGRLVLDSMTGYLVCSECGLVHEQYCFDYPFFEEPRPSKPPETKVRIMDARIKRKMLKLFGAARTREVELFLYKLKELHPELSSLIDQIEASSVRKAARIAYQRLGIPYKDVKRAVKMAGLRVNVRLKDLGSMRFRKSVEVGGKLGEETRRLRSIVSKIFLAGIPESKDAVAYVLACERLGIKFELEKVAEVYGVSPRLLKKRLREIRKVAKLAAHVLTFRYRLSVDDVAYFKDMSRERVLKEVEKYREYFTRKNYLVNPTLLREEDISRRTFSGTIARNCLLPPKLLRPPMNPPPSEISTPEL